MVADFVPELKVDEYQKDDHIDLLRARVPKERPAGERLVDAYPEQQRMARRVKDPTDPERAVNQFLGKPHEGALKAQVEGWLKEIRWFTGYAP
jgi:O-methyltransferase involved in polyketide biosynthesis